MRPRPSREWVIAELERHGVRIVAGRRGTSDNAILYKKNATSAARAANIVAHAAVSAAHEQHTNSAAAAAARAHAAAVAGTNHNHTSIGAAGPTAAAAAAASMYRGHHAAAAGTGTGTTGTLPAAAAGVAAAPSGSTAGIAAGAGTGGGARTPGAAGGAVSASGLRESFTAELGGERSEALAAARRDSLGALFGEGGMKRRTSLDSLGFAASLLSSGALDALGEMDELETSALRRDVANASAVEGDLPPTGRARRNSSLDLVRFLKSEIGLFDDDGAAGAGGGVPGSISISAGGAGDHSALAGATTAGSVMQRRLSNAALQMSLGLGGLSRGIGMDELVASSNPTPGAAVGSAAMAGPLGGLGSGSSALAAVSGLGPNATPSQHYEMLKFHHMNLLQEIQETTMMMNLYQQQMLQEQQEQLQQEKLKRQQLAAANPQFGKMNQANQQLQTAHQQVQPQMQAEAQAQIQPQQPVPNSQVQQQLLQQQVQLQNQAGANPDNNYAGQQANPGEATDESAEESIRKLRAEIAERERKMQELTSVGGGPETAATNDIKRRVSDHEDDASKRAKMAI